MNFDDTLKQDRFIRGSLSIQEIDHFSKEPISDYNDPNVIVLDSKSAIIKAIASPDANSTINKIKIGDDVGTGTDSNPQTAQDTYDSTTMSVVFNAPYALSVGFNNSTSVTFNVTIIGSDVMALYPSASSKIITSAALHTGNGNVFAYKRFPKKSISSVVDLNVTWTIHF